MTINIDAIESEARKLNELSSQYYLSHAVIGCEKMLEKKLEEASKQQVERIKKAIEETEDDEMVEKLSAEMSQINRNRAHIFVDYINFMPTCARAIMTNNNISISLPKCLQEDSGTGGAKQLRKLLAHEIGHIVLHTDKVLSNNSPRGTLTLTDDTEEIEADQFAKIILDLRCEHYKKALESRSYENYQ